jgi:hypothetical protein
MNRTAPRRAFLAGGAGLALMAQGDPNPDASVWIEELHVGLFGLTSGFGGGRLRFQGEVYAFTVEGISIAGTGVTSVRAQGEAFGLRRLQDFPGTYTEVRGGPSDGPVEVHWLRNAPGVRLRLRSARAGALLRFGEAGLKITLDQ